MVLAVQQKRMGQFRRSLRKQDWELFDELFERARAFARPHGLAKALKEKLQRRRE
jgi:hypothetical protein